MNKGPKISRGNYYYRNRLMRLIPLEEDTTEDEAIEWLENYKTWCNIELGLLPFWAWSRRRYVRGEIAYANVTARSIRDMGVEGFVRYVVQRISES